MTNLLVKVLKCFRDPFLPLLPPISLLLQAPNSRKVFPLRSEAMTARGEAQLELNFPVSRSKKAAPSSCRSFNAFKIHILETEIRDQRQLRFQVEARLVHHLSSDLSPSLATP